MIDVTEAMRAAVPTASYGCAERGCAEEVSHHAEDLAWWEGNGEDLAPGFYCEECIDHYGVPFDDWGPGLDKVLAELS